MTKQIVARALAVCLVTSSFAAVAGAEETFESQRAANWHQWRGPDATGVAPQGDPPLNWDERTNVKWKVPVPGRAVSSPIVWGDRIFLMTAVKTDRTGEPPPLLVRPPPSTQRGNNNNSRERSRITDVYQFVVLCLDRHTGSTIWQKVATEVVPHEGHHKTSSFANASPITDGKHVYCSFGSRGIYCYDLDGELKWRADVGQIQIKLGFGEGSSPALWGDTLVVKCDQEVGESFITALDTATGQPRWRTPRNEKTTWNTPLITEHNGRVQVITNGGIRSRSYDLKTGELIWEYGAAPNNDAIPSPMRIDDLAICVTGLRGNPAYAVPLGSRGVVPDGGLAWKHTRGTPQVSSPVLVKDRLYFTKQRAGVVSCVNARTGAVIIDQERLPAVEEMYASPVAAAGRVYFTGRNGATVVIDATADGMKVLAENQLDELIDSSPAIVGREMFIRGEKSLYCITK